MRIAISQRVDELVQRDERLDALDQRWAPLLESVGLTAIPLPNGLADPQAWATSLDINGLLLSGGNDIGEQFERDRSEGLLIALAEQRQWAVLGVCRGFQLINIYLGGHLRPLTDHVAVRHIIRRDNDAAQWLDILPAELEVNSFHNYGIALSDLAPELHAVMFDAHGEVEAAEHRRLPWGGIMWHPEREAEATASDRALIEKLFCR